MAAPTSNPMGGTWRASDEVMIEPVIAPSVAPTAMSPNRRLPCSGLKRSTLSCQNIETTNRLKTEAQTKNTRPTHTVWEASAR
jgi:hypothetical protein